MPNIRLTLANGEPLLFPAHAFRLMEAAGPDAVKAAPEAKAVVLYDLGDAAGVQTVCVRTSPEVVAEMVSSDPRFMNRLVQLGAGAGIGRIWLLPQHVNGVFGYVPPTDEEIAAIADGVAQIKAELAVIEAGEGDADSTVLRMQLLQLEQNYENIRSYQDICAKLHVMIPSRGDDKHLSYWIMRDAAEGISSADDVIEMIEPTPRRPSVDATPVPARAAPSLPQPRG